MLPVIAVLRQWGIPSQTITKSAAFGIRCGLGERVLETRILSCPQLDHRELKLWAEAQSRAICGLERRLINVDIPSVTATLSQVSGRRVESLLATSGPRNCSVVPARAGVSMGVCGFRSPWPHGGPRAGRITSRDRRNHPLGKGWRGGCRLFCFRIWTGGDAAYRARTGNSVSATSSAWRARHTLYIYRKNPLWLVV
jgi:hypothetical protein